MTGDGVPRHVLLVSPASESHINGMLHFACSLLQLDAQGLLLVSFGYPARAYALARQRNKLPPTAPSLRLHIIEDGLPTAEHESPSLAQSRASRMVIQNSIEALLLRFSRAGCRQEEDLVTGNEFPSASADTNASWPPICCIISDTFFPDAQLLAVKFGIPRIDFWTANATVYYMALHLPDIIARGALPLPEGIGTKWKVDAPLVDFIPGLPPFHLTELPRELLQTTDVAGRNYQFLLKAFSQAKDADQILVHSVYDLERHVFDTMQAQGFRIYAVGPLFAVDGNDSKASHPRQECLKWLDLQKPASVVYVALGTVAKLNKDEMRSMAIALEESHHPFLWVIRADVDMHETLPVGFLERTVSKGKGLIVAWAPQTKVLEHSAVGVFISHCGWNSVLESLWEGVPMVACPRAAEQRCNTKYVVKDWKVGAEIEREDDGGFTSENVQKALEDVMGNKEIKERALHVRQLVKHAIGQNGSSHSNILAFIDSLLCLAVPIREELCS